MLINQYKNRYIYLNLQLVNMFKIQIKEKEVKFCVVPGVKRLTVM